MLILNENSGLVKMWVQAVKDGRYKREDAPNLSNLREVVFKVLDEEIME